MNEVVQDAIMSVYVVFMVFAVASIWSLVKLNSFMNKVERKMKVYDDRVRIIDSVFGIDPLLETENIKINKDKIKSNSFISAVKNAKGN